MRTHKGQVYPDVMIFDDICNEDLLDLVYQQALLRGPNAFPFYEKNDIFDLDPCYQLIKKLVNQVWLDKLSYLLPEVHAGWEVWYNIMQEKRDLSIHIDCDERAPDWVLPYWGSIIYAGPKGISNMIGGDLHYNIDLKDALMNTDKDAPFDKDTVDCGKPLIIPYRYNRVVVFNEAPHWVGRVEKLPNNEEPRLGISCAVWEHKTEPIISKSNY